MAEAEERGCGGVRVGGGQNDGGGGGESLSEKMAGFRAGAGHFLGPPSLLLP